MLEPTGSIIQASQGGANFTEEEANIGRESQEINRATKRDKEQAS